MRLENITPESLGTFRSLISDLHIFHQPLDQLASATAEQFQIRRELCFVRLQIPTI